MAKTYNKYQYGTSPRKLEPEYAPIKEPYKKKKTTIKNVKKIKKSRKEQLKKQRKTIMYIMIGFAILFAIIYRNAKIDENFSKVRKLKKELSVVEKENAQLEVSIANNLNLNNIEQQAKELLGMQKLSNKQKVYVSLPKSDYIESAAENVKIEEDNFLQSIIKDIKNIL